MASTAKTTAGKLERNKTALEAKAAGKEFDENDILPAHEKRKLEAEYQRQRNRQPDVKERWFEWVFKDTLNPKKGKKLVMKEKTETGVNVTYVGHEKKIPVAYLKKLRSENLIKNDNLSKK